jgi:nitrate reductase NapE component
MIGNNMMLSGNNKKYTMDIKCYIILFLILLIVIHNVIFFAAVSGFAIAVKSICCD